MRKIVVALVVAALALTLTACSSGSSKDAKSTAGSGSAASAPAPAADPNAAVIPDASPTEPQSYTALIQPGMVAPAAVAQRVKAKQPFILVFYDEAQPVTKDQKAAIATVQKRYRGLADLVTFNLGKYVTQNANGAITVDSSLLKDKNAAQVAALAESLGVTGTPYIVVVDKNGYVTFKAKGFVDEGQLEQEVLRVGE